MRITRKLKLFISQSSEICDKVKKNDNKNKVRTFFDIVGCSIKYKASPHNYDVLGFAQLDKKQRKTYFTFNDNLKMMAKFNSKKHEAIFYNKFIFSKVFSDFYGRKCVMTNFLTQQEFDSFVSGDKKIIYKPVNSAQGKGVTVFDLCDYESTVQLYEQIKSLPNGIIETWIHQHPALSALYPDSVNPIRVNTVFSDGICYPIASTLSIGHNAKIANASINALFALVDVKTGTVLSPACDYDGNTYETHPQTGAPFCGFTIPFWSEVLEMLEHAVRTVPQVGYIGWDIAITETGPVLIEGNNDPGYIGFQLPLFTHGTGTHTLYSKFLGE